VSGARKYATCGKIRFIAILLNVKDRQQIATSNQQPASSNQQQQQQQSSYQKPNATIIITIKGELQAR